MKVANAVGAALSQVSGVVDHVVDVGTLGREKYLADAEFLAIKRAIENGARADTITIVDKSDIQLPYSKGASARVQVKAVGDLAVGKIHEI